MDLAIEYKLQHFQESYRAVAQQFSVSHSTLSDRCQDRHLSHQQTVLRHLSRLQELVLVAQINAYAARGTLLTPQHVHELAERIAGGEIGERWVARFLERHSDKISSRYRTYRELGRLQADTPETRRAFYTLVSVWEV